MNSKNAAKNAFQLENAQPFLFFSRSPGARPAASSRETELGWPELDFEPPLLVDMAPVLVVFFDGRRSNLARRRDARPAAV
jgi:hypothetical protein